MSNERDDYDDDFDDRSRRKSGIPAWAIVLIVMGVCGLITVPIAIGIGLLLPAVQKVREAAARTNDGNNLKEMALGYHAYHDTYGNIPVGVANPGNQLNRQLSSRVVILPYIEQENIFSQFQLSEAWDSPTNRPLGDLRIDTFVSATDGPDETRTRYLGFTGPGTMFDPSARSIRLTEVTDGTSNTILLVKSNDLVIYSRPKEIPYTPGMPIKPTLQFQNGTTPIMMADGSLKMVSDSVSEVVLQAAVTRNGGEPVKFP